MKTKKYIRFALLGGLLALASCAFTGSSNQDVVSEYMSRNALIVDVRTTGEYQSGNAEGSINIPLSSLEGQLDSLKSLDRPLIMVCKSGMRAAVALEQVKNHQIDAINAGSWQSFQENE